MNELKTININEIKSMDNIELIDIREADEVRSGMIKGAKHVPMMGLIMNPDNFLNKDTEYYIYCASGGRSMQTCAHLNNLGYKTVNLAGGIASYTE